MCLTLLSCLFTVVVSPVFLCLCVVMNLLSALLISVVSDLVSVAVLMLACCSMFGHLSIWMKLMFSAGNLCVMTWVVVLSCVITVLLSVSLGVIMVLWTWTDSLIPLCAVCVVMVLWTDGLKVWSLLGSCSDSLRNWRPIDCTLYVSALRGELVLCVVKVATSWTTWGCCLGGRKVNGISVVLLLIGLLLTILLNCLSGCVLDVSCLAMT